MDDAALTLLSSPPKAFVRAIRIRVDTLIRVFTQFRCIYNVVKGKDESAAVLRGKCSSEVADTVRGSSKDASCFGFNLPAPYDHCKLRPVQRNERPVTHGASNGKFLVDALHRLSVAVQAYTPVASQVLASSYIPVRPNITLMTYLLFSRLLYSTQI